MENKVFKIGSAEMPPILSKDSANREQRQMENKVFKIGSAEMPPVFCKEVQIESRAKKRMFKMHGRSHGKDLLPYRPGKLPAGTGIFFTDR